MGNKKGGRTKCSERKKRQITEKKYENRREDRKNIDENGMTRERHKRG
jgi:hypothetical protein